MSSRFLIVSALLGLAAAVSAPVMAAESACVRTSVQIRTLAVSNADADNTRKALTLVSVGEKLCDAGARSEANKKFSAAAKLLGSDLAAVNVAPTAQ